MSTQKITVPDIGDAEDVEVIEVCVNAGDEVDVDDILVVVESDKASMEIPSPLSGKVASVTVKLGDNVSFGSDIVTLETSETKSDAGIVAEALPAEPETEEPKAKNLQSSTPEASEPEAKESVPESNSVQTVSVPDIGDSEAVVVIELLVKPGDAIVKDDLLVVIESEKASMEIPSPFAGVVEKILVKEGDEVVEGSDLLTVLSTSSVIQDDVPVDAPAEHAKPTPIPVNNAEVKKTKTPEAEIQTADPSLQTAEKQSVYAGPAVRKLAREMGVNLPAVNGTGAGGRITKDDVNVYVKAALAGKSGQASHDTGSGIPAIPAVDFSKFGSIQTLPLSRIRKRGAANLHRSWLNVPHVTQNDEADVSDLEDFRKRMAAEAKKRNIRLTPLAFIIKAACFALKEFPVVNSSLDQSAENYILKNYYNIGMAVDTPEGLVVPVVKGVDDKGIWSIAEEVIELSEKARLGKLSVTEMQGASFTISSLGPIGGTSFTPIVNAPEVAILGVSRLVVKPVWDGENFVPRKMLPVSLSYDHRAINGAEAGRFTTYLCAVLKDFREGMM